MKIAKISCECLFSVIVNFGALTTQKTLIPPHKMDQTATCSKNSRKRRPDDDAHSYEPQAKVFQAEHIFNISHFSDEILLEILMHLDSESIYNFGCTCTRFKELTKDKQLWQVFDFDSIPLSGIEILRRMRYINSDTRIFRIRGLQGTYPDNNWRNATITELMLTMLTDMCPKLEEFSLTQGFLNTSKVRVIIPISRG